MYTVIHCTPSCVLVRARPVRPLAVCHFLGIGAGTGHGLGAAAISDVGQVSADLCSLRKKRRCANVHCDGQRRLETARRTMTSPTMTKRPRLGIAHLSQLESAPWVCAASAAGDGRNRDGPEARESRQTSAARESKSRCCTNCCWRRARRDRRPNSTSCRAGR